MEEPNAPKLGWIGRRSARGKLDDGLDPRAWQLVYDTVTAACSVDADRYAAALRRVFQVFPAEDPAQRWLYVYVRWMLRYKVFEHAGDEPTRDDLLETAGGIYRKFAKLQRVDRNVLEKTLLTALNMLSQEDEIPAGLLVGYGSAALGLLIEKPKPELEELRVYLSEYVQENADELRTLLGIDAPAS